MIAMLIAFTIGGQNFERYEPMPDLATCWQRAPERMNALLAVHPEITNSLSAVSSTMATRSDLLEVLSDALAPHLGQKACRLGARTRCGRAMSYDASTWRSTLTRCIPARTAFRSAQFLLGLALPTSLEQASGRYRPCGRDSPHKTHNLVCHAEPGNDRSRRLRKCHSLISRLLSWPVPNWFASMHWCVGERLGSKIEATLPPDPPSADYPVRLTFLLPDTILVSPGPPGFNTAVLPGNVVRIRGREARHCFAPAREFFAVVAWDRALPAARWSRETMTPGHSAGISPWCAARW